MLTINLKTVWNTGVIDTDSTEITNKNLRYSGFVHKFQKISVSEKRFLFQHENITYLTAFFLSLKVEKFGCTNSISIQIIVHLAQVVFVEFYIGNRRPQNPLS